MLCGFSACNPEGGASGDRPASSTGPLDDRSLLAPESKRPAPLQDTESHEMHSLEVFSVAALYWTAGKCHQGVLNGQQAN